MGNFRAIGNFRATQTLRDICGKINWPFLSTSLRWAPLSFLSPFSPFHIDDISVIEAFLAITAVIFRFLSPQNRCLKQPFCTTLKKDKKSLATKCKA